MLWLREKVPKKYTASEMILENKMTVEEIFQKKVMHRCF